MATLAELEGRQAWPPESDETFLMRRCRELMSKDLGQFTVEDLRIMLGQRLGVEPLLGRAVRILLDDPLASGDFFPGDLLMVVLRLPEDIWNRFPLERRHLSTRLQSVMADDKELSRRIAAFQATTADRTTRRRQ